MSKSPAVSFPDQLRALIAESGRTNYELAHATGVSESQIWRFLHGKDVRFESAGKLMAHLGVEPLKIGRKARKPSPAGA